MECGNYFPLSQPSLFLYCKVLCTKHVKCIAFFLLHHRNTESTMYEYDIGRMVFKCQSSAKLRKSMESVRQDVYFIVKFPFSKMLLEKFLMLPLITSRNAGAFRFKANEISFSFATLSKSLMCFQ